MKNLEFKKFLESGEANKDALKTIKKLPKSHQNLIKGYKIVFQNGNTLKKDKSHVGLVNDKNKIIIIASPWFHSRDFTLLHEIGHLIWKSLLAKEAKEKWKSICKSRDKRQNEEEIFCHSYANYFCKYPTIEHRDKDYSNFIKNLT